MAKPKHPYPEKLFVRHEPTDQEEGYFVADADPVGHAELNGSKVRIAIYRLEQIADVAAEVTVEPVV